MRKKTTVITILACVTGISTLIGTMLGLSLITDGALPSGPLKYWSFVVGCFAVALVSLFVMARLLRKSSATVPEQPTAAAIPPASEEMQQEFAKLCKEWNIWDKEHAICSMPTEWQSPAWEKTLAMGMPIVPLILEELRDHPQWWMLLALHEITHTSPFSEKDAGRFSKMINAWLKWGYKNRYIVPKRIPKDHFIG